MNYLIYPMRIKLNSNSNTIRITAVGNYNVAMAGGSINPKFWQSSSSKSVLEAVVQYTP